jgi:hypothetical protein
MRVLTILVSKSRRYKYALQLCNDIIGEQAKRPINRFTILHVIPYTSVLGTYSAVCGLRTLEYYYLLNVARETNILRFLYTTAA